MNVFALSVLLYIAWASGLAKNLHYHPIGVLRGTYMGQYLGHGWSCSLLNSVSSSSSTTSSRYYHVMLLSYVPDATFRTRDLIVALIILKGRVQSSS